MKTTYTKEELVKLVDAILQFPDQIIDAVTNENTVYGANELINLALNPFPVSETLLPKTEKDYIKDAILKARQLHFDGKTPSDLDVEKVENDLYDNLFGYRDSKKESPLDRPSAYHLIDIFKELKFGRTQKIQKYLQKCIEELETES